MSISASEPPPFSSSVAKRLDWNRVTDAFGVLSQTERATASDTVSDKALTDEERAHLRHALNVLKEEFSRVLRSLSRAFQIVVLAMVVALALAVAGGALLQVTPYASVISIAGVGALFGLLGRAWQLARDQAMLELIPARYALAIEGCRTTRDAQKFISTFLAETASLQARRR